MRIVFMGTPAFAVPSLQALLDAGYEVAGVITQPDRPSGRGNRVVFSPVKELALAHGLRVLQPQRIRRDGVEDLRSLKPDLCVTAAFGQILSQEVLDIPPMGTVNVHASLLPRHRGSAPIAWAILEGDQEVGVTTMLTDAGIDTGHMLLKRSMPRDPGMTCGEMTEVLSRQGAELLVETLKAMEAGTVRPEPQNEAEMTYDPMLRKEMGFLDFQESGEETARRILGLNPWPGCSVPLEGGRLKFLRARAGEGTGRPGEILRSEPGKPLLIACLRGAVEILTLQSPGGKAMQAGDWLRGHRLDEGSIIGEEHA